MGRLLKKNSQMDKTRAGKMMAAVGKAQSVSSQQRYVNNKSCGKNGFFL